MIFTTTVNITTHSCFKILGLMSKFIPLNWFLTPCSSLLIPGILAVAKIRPKSTYEHQCSFHRQCNSDIAVFSPWKLSQWRTVAQAWNICVPVWYSSHNDENIKIVMLKKSKRFLTFVFLFLFVSHLREHLCVLASAGLMKTKSAREQINCSNGTY